MDIDNIVSSEIKKDVLPFEMDPGAEHRLMHAANLYASNHSIRKNSMLDAFLSLFSLQMIGVKAAFIAIILIFSLGTGKFLFQNQQPLHCDSTSVNTILIDSLDHRQGMAVDSIVN